MDEMTQLFEDLLRTYGSVDIAEAEFKHLIDEDSELHADYRLWCEENGYTEKRGFLDFADEYLDSQQSIWDVLSDYDE